MTKFIKVEVKANGNTAYLNVNNILGVFVTDDKDTCLISFITTDQQILVNESQDSLINKINSVSGL